MWHRDQVPRDDIFGHIIPLLDNKIIIGLLPENTAVQLRRHSSLEIIILQEVYKLKRRGVQFEFIPELKLQLSPLLLKFNHCKNLLRRRPSRTSNLQLVFYNNVKVIKPSLMLFQKVLGYTKAHILTSIELHFLENSQRVENVSHLYLVVREISYDVWVGHKYFHNFVTPLDHFEVLIIVSIQVHVK